MKLRIVTFFLLTALLAVSCASGPVEIPDNLTAAELIQQGQEASDRNRYTVSLQYYQAVIGRFPSDIDNICAAEYEIAFIHYKQKQYDTAKAEFNRLLEHYNNNPDEALLPQQYKVLSRIVLDKISEAESAEGEAKSP